MKKNNKNTKKVKTNRTLAESASAFRVFMQVLVARLAAIKTVLFGKKVFLAINEEYDLDHSVLMSSEKSDEGGYMRSGIAYRIPKDIRYLRFFVYWNDKSRVDIDLHASAITKSGAPLHIGWNSDFRNSGIIFSGDITHSDAAEFIDVDLENTSARQVDFNINLFSGRDSFKNVERVFVGMMGIGRDDIGKEFALYDPANCFFSHILTTETRNINYGFLDVENRCLMYLGRDANGEGYTARGADTACSKFSIGEYIRALLCAQKVTVVDNRDDADIVLVMGKPQSEKEVSLVDNNFFFEA